MRVRTRRQRWGLGQGEDANPALAVVGNVQSRRSGDQVGVAAQVAPGEYHVPNVGGVCGDEAVPPIVHGDAELTRAEDGSKRFRSRRKRKSAPCTETGAASGRRRKVISPVRPLLEA